jgi:ligand-binding sensor domain-containing protein
VPTLRWLLALALFVVGVAWAGPAPTLRFEHLSVEDGLGQESVLSIAQDRDGFMWFGTQTGLSRFDGYRFTNYRNVVGDARTLANNWVRVLLVDRKGRLWLGTDGGLDRFEPSTQTFVHYQPAVSTRRGNGDRHIHAIVEDGKGGLWLATGDGLHRFDIATGKFESWHHVAGDERSLGDDQVNALAVDGAGVLWIGTSTGLDSFERAGGVFRHHRAELDARHVSVRSLLVDAAGALWIGSGAGVERWQTDGKGGTARRSFGLEEGIRPGEVNVLYADAERHVWVGTREDGLYRWQSGIGRFENYHHLPSDAHSLADNQVSALYRDRVGTFWAGTWYAGVSRVDLGSGGFARVVRQADSPHTLGDNKVQSIESDGAGQLWLGTNTGLNHYDPETGMTRVYRHDPANPNSLVDFAATAVTRDRRGVLWIGSRNGITSFDPASGRFVRQQLAAADADTNNIRFMRTTRDGTVWISTRGGLQALDPTTRKVVASYRHDPAKGSSLADNVVRPVLEDRHGRLWVGTFDGLDLLDRASGRFRHFRHDPADPTSLSHDEVHHLMEDRRGDIWVGTAVGLNRIVTARDGSISFVRYTSRDGLVDDAVASMLEDDDGRIWISTTTGLSCFDPATGHWRSYGAADGTIEGAYFDGAALRGADGTLYFGGFNGITAFSPRAIRDNRIAPRAVITGFQVFNQPIEQVHPGLLKGPIEHATSITLAADESVFSLEFSALHFAAPQRNRFAYKLDGFDQAWVRTDASKRFATYTNLDPGHYVFRVRAANKDGVWGADAATLAITIEPPFWKTWWFRTLAVLLVLGAGWGAVKARVSRLRRQKEQLEREVGARIEEIKLQNWLLERQTQELREQQRQVRENTDELALANRALQDNE